MRVLHVKDVLNTSESLDILKNWLKACPALEICMCEGMDENEGVLELADVYPRVSFYLFSFYLLST